MEQQSKEDRLIRRPLSSLFDPLTASTRTKDAHHRHTDVDIRGRDADANPSYLGAGIQSRIAVLSL